MVDILMNLKFYFFLCINCLCNKICFRSLLSLISAKLSQIKKYSCQYCPKPHFSRAFPNFWRAVYIVRRMSLNSNQGKIIPSVVFFLKNFKSCAWIIFFNYFNYFFYILFLLYCICCTALWCNSVAFKRAIEINFDLTWTILSEKLGNCFRLCAACYSTKFWLANRRYLVRKWS